VRLLWNRTGGGMALYLSGHRHFPLSGSKARCAGLVGMPMSGHRNSRQGGLWWKGLATLVMPNRFPGLGCGAF
jgi:hypothetical protein